MLNNLISETNEKLQKSERGFSLMRTRQPTQLRREKLDLNVKQLRQEKALLSFLHQTGRLEFY